MLRGCPDLSRREHSGQKIIWTECALIFFVVRSDGLITLTCSVLQTFQIEKSYFSARIFD
jgi:hypothetical protein